MAGIDVLTWVKGAARAAAPVLTGLAALCAAAAQANSTVNISTTHSSEYVDFYASVTLIGAGGGTLNFVGEPGEDWSGGSQEDALAAALAYFGLSLSTPLVDITDTPLEQYEVFTEDVNANGAVFDIDYIGDEFDYLTWIAIGANDVNVEVTQVTTYFTPHALTATIAPVVSEVPLPAGAVLFASALGLSGLFRKKRAS